MPLFRFHTSKELKNLFQEKSLKELKELNQHYDKLFENFGKRETSIYNQINAINQAIIAKQLEIAEHEDVEHQAQTYRQNVLDNLPADPAKRYLILKGIAYGHDKGPELREELKSLEQSKVNLTGRQNMLGAEFQACIKEFKIINAVINEKELDLKAPKFALS
ncbi:hypothetical protein [Legionella gresilensis]|uniref:hypothetical protein n=1 Tax=Legionella gresilensis TaxID=91823 RepID=UPI0010414D9D|nr:hypothetical protein [Legionella gresilensis]